MNSQTRKLFFTAILLSVLTGLQADIIIDPGAGSGAVIPNIDKQPEFESPICYSDGNSGEVGELGRCKPGGLLLKVEQGSTWTGGGSGMVVAWCPPGTWVVGGGASTEVSAPMYVTASAPLKSMSSGWLAQGWEVRAKTDTCYQGDWSITAIAYCSELSPILVP